MKGFAELRLRPIHLSLTAMERIPQKVQSLHRDLCLIPGNAAGHSPAKVRKMVKQEETKIYNNITYLTIQFCDYVSNVQ